MMADACAILDVDALRLVDENPDEPAPGSALPIDELVPQRGKRPFQQFGKVQSSSWHKLARKSRRAGKKNGLCPAHFFS